MFGITGWVISLDNYSPGLYKCCTVQYSKLHDSRAGGGYILYLHFGVNGGGARGRGK